MKLFGLSLTSHEAVPLNALPSGLVLHLLLGPGLAWATPSLKTCPVPLSPSPKPYMFISAFSSTPSGSVVVFDDFPFV